MLLQTNSYVVPKQHRAEHSRLLARFRNALARVGCDLFEVYEQANANWDAADKGDGRFVQILRFRDREHQQAVRSAERMDLEAQSLIEEFCRLINFPYQQEHGLFAVGFYTELEPELSPVPPESGSQAILDQFDEPPPEGADAVPLVLNTADPNPATEVQMSGLPLAGQELDELFHAQFAPASSCTQPAVGVGDPELARVLDAGLALDDLDIPMEAELLDEPESPGDQQSTSSRQGEH